MDNLRGMALGFSTLPPMPRSHQVPVELTHGPFTTRAAARFGISLKQLDGGSYRRLFHSVYMWRGCAITPGLLIAGARLVLPPCAVISGRAAAHLYGLDLWEGQVEAVVPAVSAVRSQPGLLVRHADLPASDVIVRQGMPVTSALRTAFDLARYESYPEGVVCLDAMLQKHLVTHHALLEYLLAHAGVRGVRHADRSLRLSRVGVESPMETRPRLVLVEAGLPDPAVNEPVFGPDRTFLARPDLRIDHVIIEFDGDGHRKRSVFVSDLRRQNRLVEAGYVVLRFTAADVWQRPEQVVRHVRTALGTRRDAPNRPYTGPG